MKMIVSQQWMKRIQNVRWMTNNYPIIQYYYYPQHSFLPQKLRQDRRCSSFITDIVIDVQVQIQKRYFSSNNNSGVGGGVDSTIDDENASSISILNQLEYVCRGEIPMEDVRNFCMIAHVDHGKSSLAYRLLEETGNIGVTCPQRKEQIDLLDTLQVEKERGITVKASAASMLLRHDSAVGKHGLLLLNMVDTPGHVDFGAEVTKTLAVVQGSILLLDASQGVQAQTLSVYEKASSQNITIIPALTKVDLPSANPMEVALTVSELFTNKNHHFDPDTILETSARNNIGISSLLDIIATQVPPPSSSSVQNLQNNHHLFQAQVIDSWFETKRGVICLIQMVSGTLHENDRVSLLQQQQQQQLSSKQQQYSIQEIGIVAPHRIRTKVLHAGQMGYIMMTGLRDPRQAKSGTKFIHPQHYSHFHLDQKEHDTTTNNESSSVLYASVHPLEVGNFDALVMAVEKLSLNDSGLNVQKTSSNNSNNSAGSYLGPGLRIGFQGLLHIEVFRQRLFDEFQLEAIVTPPKVPYTIHYYIPKKQQKSSTKQTKLPETPQIIEDLSQWPSSSSNYYKFRVEEPIVQVRIMSPMEYAGNIMDLMKKKRATNMHTKPINDSTWLFTSTMPWAEVVTDFHDDLKNTSAGYASFDIINEQKLQEAPLVKVDISLNGDIVEPLAFVAHVDVAQAQGRVVCKKLQDVLPRQQYVTVIQAKSNGKVIAR